METLQLGSWGHGTEIQSGDYKTTAKAEFLFERLIALKHVARMTNQVLGSATTAAIVNTVFYYSTNINDYLDTRGREIATIVFYLAVDALFLLTSAETCYQVKKLSNAYLRTTSCLKFEEF